MRPDKSFPVEKRRIQTPLVLIVSKEEFDRYTDLKTEAEKSSEVANKKLEKLTRLKKISCEVTKDWENAVGTIKKRRRDELLSRRKNIENTQVRLMKQLTAENASERDRIVKEAQKMILYRKPQCRLINRALFASECFRELNAQLKFKKKIESLEQNEDKQYVDELEKKRKIQLDREQMKSEESLKKKQVYANELKKQIENANIHLQRVELQDKKADKIDLENMVKELQLIEKCEADQMRKRKEEAKQNYFQVLNDNKRIEAEMKHNEELEDRVIAAYVKTRDHLNRITKNNWKQSQADKLRRSELMAEKCASLWKSNEDEMNGCLERQREHFKKIELEKLQTKRKMQEKMRADLQKYQMDYVAMKKKREEERKNINAWETLQRFKRDEYNKEMKSKESQRVWKKKMETANALREQMAEQEAVRKREALMDDDSAFIKAALERTNEKVIAYGQEVLEESKGVRPLFPIIKAIETFKKESGLIPPQKYEEIESPREDEIRRRINTKIPSASDAFYFG